MEVSTPVYIDSDNALGSPSGDIDDGLALAALYRSGYPIVAVGSVFGNTSTELAHRNNQVLAAMCGYRGSQLLGAGTRNDRARPVADFLSRVREPFRILALGPLTNIAPLVRHGETMRWMSEIITVSTNGQLPLPPWRVFDFNRSLDPLAFLQVFHSPLKLTIVPLAVARRLRVTMNDLRFGPLADYFAKHARRWFRRALIMKGARSIPAWDLVGALYVLFPSLFATQSKRVSLTRFGCLKHAPSGREVNWITQFDENLARQRFIELLGPPLLQLAKGSDTPTRHRQA